jgi:hypothetical protein
MAIQGLYRKAKNEVDEEYDQIKALGFKPKRNEDGKTYSWVNDKGEIYTGSLNPTPGMDAESGWGKRHFTREARQNRLMSEKVSAELPLQGPVKKEEVTPGGTTPGSTTTTTTTPKVDTVHQNYDAWWDSQMKAADDADKAAKDADAARIEEEKKKPAGGLDKNPLIARPIPKTPRIGWYPGDQNILT